MPRLRTYADGSGFYIKAFVPNVGHCTYQIGQGGLAYLRERGIRCGGDEVSQQELRELREKEQVWCVGDGRRELLDECPAPPELTALAADLRQWAQLGTLAALTNILCHRHGDQR